MIGDAMRGGVVWMFVSTNEIVWSDHELFGDLQ